MIRVECNEDGTVCLTGEATIHHAEELYTELLACLRKRPEEVVLHLGGLTELDTAGAQILIAFKRALPAVRVHSCPNGLREFLSQTALVSLLL